MNCNAKKKELSQHISASRTLYVKESYVAREPRFGYPCSIHFVSQVSVRTGYVVLALTLAGEPRFDVGSCWSPAAK
jgi:hypothetical protein